MLTDLWAVGRRTVSICSLDSYVDCPTREQRAWTGDSVVHQMVDLTTNADWTLARWHPRLTASPRPDGMLPMAVAGDIEASDFTIIPDWALHWVHSVWNLYRYVGDRDEVAALLPVAEGVVCAGSSRSATTTGVPTDVYGWVIIDWASVYTEGVSAALCGLWGRALLELAEMAEWLGDAGRAAWARRTPRAPGRRLRAAVGSRCRERYVDSWIPGADRPMASQHGQAAAIVGGLARPNRHDTARRGDDRRATTSSTRRSRTPTDRRCQGPRRRWAAVLRQRRTPSRGGTSDAPGRASAAVLPLRRPRRAGRRRAGRSHRDAAARLALGARALPDVAHRDLVRRHRQPRLVVDADARPRAAGPRRHPRRARASPPRASSRRSATSTGHAGGSRPSAARSRSRSPRITTIVDSPMPIVHGDERLPAGRHRIDLRSTP